MFDDYSIDQLLHLRELCAYSAENGEGPEKCADALLLLEFIEEELAQRDQDKCA